MGKTSDRKHNDNPRVKRKLIQELNAVDNNRKMPVKRSRLEGRDERPLPRIETNLSQGMDKSSNNLRSKNNVVVKVVTGEVSGRKILHKNDLRNKLVDLASKDKKVNYRSEDRSRSSQRYDVPRPKVKSKIVIPTFQNK